MTYELKLSTLEALKIIQPLKMDSSEITSNPLVKDDISNFIDGSGIKVEISIKIYDKDIENSFRKVVPIQYEISLEERLFMYGDSIILIFENREDALLFKMSCL